MYEIRMDVEGRLIHDKLVGFWDLATAERFLRDFNAAIDKVAAAGPGWKILADYQEMDVQTPEVVALLSKVAAYAEANGLAKAAVYMPGILKSLQIKRMGPADKFRTFASEAEARAWLEE
jgi:hypothetical protein